MDVIYLSVEIVQDFHTRALREHGGIAGLRSQELLESAVFQPQQSAFGEDAYPTPASKAAAYGFFIAQNQPFLDGNKRTAAASMLASFISMGTPSTRPTIKSTQPSSVLPRKICLRLISLHGSNAMLAPKCEAQFRLAD